MKVLIVANYKEGIGGISGVVYNHVCKLQEEGYQVNIFNTRVSIIKRLFLVFSLSKAVKQVDVVHAHGCSFWGFFPVFISVIACKLIQKKRLIVTYHGGGADDYLRRNTYWIVRFLKQVDTITVMSGFLESVFAKYNIKTIILPNLSNVIIQKEICADFAKPKLVSVRSHEEIYNVCDIIDAFAIIKKQYPNAELKILGKGSLTDELKKQVHTLALQHVEFFGAVTSEQVPDILRSSNIFISVSSFDNQPMSVLEAFASGIPVIASNVGGVPFMVRDHYSGLLVDVHAPDQIADKVIWIMNHREDTNTMIKNAQAELAMYQWSHIKQILEKLYNN